MAKVTIQSTYPDDYVNAPGFTPALASVTASQTFVTITVAQTPPALPLSGPILVAGDVVEPHDTASTKHDTATMNATIQTYVKINGAVIVVDGDAATCTHLIVATTQSFVTIS